jgi:hypothetical protein
VLTRSFGTNRLRSLEPLLVRTLATRALDPPIERPCPCGAPLRIIASEGLSRPEVGGDRWRLGLQGRGTNPLGVRAYSPSGENPRVTDEPLLTEPEAAKVLRVSARTLKRWRLAGSGPPVAGYAGRSPRYRRSELLAWIRRGKPAT